MTSLYRRKGFFMKYTSSEAAKLLRKLNEEHTLLKEKEDATFTFHAAMGEDPEELRPEYNFLQTQRELDRLEENIRRLRHAINLFNLSTEVEGMTIDQVLVYLPQLQERKRKLGKMLGRLPRQRADVFHSYRGGTSIIDYVYANYNSDEVKAEYDLVSEAISRLQMGLDLANASGTLEVDLLP